MAPPVVKITRQLASQDDSVYTLSRLRDHNLYNNVRLYLAYLHDQTNDVCIDGKTNTHLKILIQQEGLPTKFNELYALYVRFCSELHVSESAVKADLASFRSNMQNKRRIHLQNAMDAEKRMFKR